MTGPSPHQCSFRGHLMFLCLVVGVIATPAVVAETTPGNSPDMATTTAPSMPTRGMRMAEVEKLFGAPREKSAAVGKPPISRWDYDGFSVYFEYDHVIHAIAIDAAPPEPPKETAE